MVYHDLNGLSIAYIINPVAPLTADTAKTNSKIFILVLVVVRKAHEGRCPQSNKDAESLYMGRISTHKVPDCNRQTD